MTAPLLQPNDADLELLSAYIDNQLAEHERQLLEQRLQSEPQLQKAFDEISTMVQLLHDLEPLKPPRAFTLDPAEFQPRKNPFSRLLGFVPATAVVLLICSFTVLFVGRNISRVANAPMAGAPMESQSMAPTSAAGMMFGTVEQTLSATAMATGGSEVASAPTAAAAETLLATSEAEPALTGDALPTQEFMPAASDPTQVALSGEATSTSSQWNMDASQATQSPLQMNADANGSALSLAPSQQLYERDNFDEQTTALAQLPGNLGSSETAEPYNPDNSAAPKLVDRDQPAWQSRTIGVGIVLLVLLVIGTAFWLRRPRR